MKASSWIILAGIIILAMLGGGIIREVTGIFGLGIPVELRRDGARLAERIREFEASQTKDRELIRDNNRIISELIGENEELTDELGRVEAEQQARDRIYQQLTSLAGSAEEDINQGQVAVREAYSGVQELERIIDKLE